MNGTVVGPGCQSDSVNNMTTFNMSPYYSYHDF